MTDVNGLEVLRRTLKFPLVVYKKENGYLGLIAYNEYTDDLFFTTKSNPDGDYARHFKELFNKLVSTDKKEKLKSILKEKDATLAVEVVDLATFLVVLVLVCLAVLLVVF